MTATALTPSASSWRRSCTRSSITAFTYGQWLQMKATSVPFGPLRSASRWRLPSTPWRSKSAACQPSGRGIVEVVAMLLLRPVPQGNLSTLLCPVQHGRDDGAQVRAHAVSQVLAEGEGRVLVHVGDLRQLELHGLYALGRAAVVAGDVAALEATVEHARI